MSQSERFLGSSGGFAGPVPSPGRPDLSHGAKSTLKWTRRGLGARAAWCRPPGARDLP